MFLLLCQVIGTSGGKIQQLAASALLEVAKCANKDKGCTTAQQNEIDTLLNALLSPCVAVRETVFQVCLRASCYAPFTIRWCSS